MALGEHAQAGTVDHGRQPERARAAQVVEKFTAHYVFALGLSRFISCAHWLLQIIDGDSFLLQAIGSGLWPLMVLASELVQTFILADFWCAPGALLWLRGCEHARHDLPVLRGP